MTEIAESKVYSEPGKGRKQCKCGAYIGGRLTVCPACNKPYEKNPSIVTKTINVFHEGGVGRKPCKCGAFVGVRTAVCPSCNATFEKDNSEVVSPTETEAPKRVHDPYRMPFTIPPQAMAYTHNKVYVILIAPSGKCPVPLKSFDKNSLDEWMEQLIEHGLKDKRIMSLEAIKCYLKQFIDINTPQFKEVCALMEEHSFEDDNDDI